MTAASSYKALVESATRLVEVDAIGDVDELDVSAASVFLRRNQLVLDTARLALGPKCKVPLRFEKAFFAEHCDHLLHLRNLASVFRAEAWLAARNEDYRAAARVGVDILELANAVRRGGLVVDLQVGLVISDIAMESLRGLRSKVDLATRRFLMDELQRLESQREAFAGIVSRDHDWEVAVGYDDKPCAFGSQERSDPDECGLSKEQQNELLQLLQHIADLPEPDRRKIEFDQDQHIIALMRIMVVDLALRISFDSSGSFPDDLSALIPRPLAQVPADPYTGTQLIYRRIGNTFCLYSTGPKMKDGGGQFGAWPSVAAGRADLCLDAGDYYPDIRMVGKRYGVGQRIAARVRAWWDRAAR